MLSLSSVPVQQLLQDGHARARRPQKRISPRSTDRRHCTLGSVRIGASARGVRGRWESRLHSLKQEKTSFEKATSADAHQRASDDESGIEARRWAAGRGRERSRARPERRDRWSGSACSSWRERAAACRRCREPCRWRRVSAALVEFCTCSCGGGIIFPACPLSSALSVEDSCMTHAPPPPPYRAGNNKLAEFQARLDAAAQGKGLKPPSK